MVYTFRHRHVESVKRKAFSDEIASGSITAMTLHYRCLVLVRNPQHLVGVMGEVEIHVPVEILGPHQVAVQGHLDSGIPHVSDIVIVSAVTDGLRKSEEIKHVRSLAVEVFHST